MSYSLTAIAFSHKNKSWINRKNGKALKIVIKTQILSCKTIEGNRRLRVKARFLLFYSELASTDPWCGTLQTLLPRKNMRRKCQMNNCQMIFWLCWNWFEWLLQIEPTTINILIRSPLGDNKPVTMTIKNIFSAKIMYNVIII